MYKNSMIDNYINIISKSFVSMTSNTRQLALLGKNDFDI